MKKPNKSSTSGSKNGSSIGGSISISNPREITWKVLLAAFSDRGFASDHLDQWNRQAQPSDENYRFAQELSYGCLRLALTLDYLAGQLADKKKLSLKLKEKILVRMGLYQCYYMDKVPHYAAIHETVELSKKICHPSFSSFLNAILRKAVQKTPLLPSGNTIKELSHRFSYPELFIKKILTTYPIDQAKEIFQAGNEPGHLLFRIRTKECDFPFITVVSKEPFMGTLNDKDKFPFIIQSTEFYIQNITPAFLIQELCKKWDKDPPKRIVDLCASPGGKLIALHDKFPEAEFFANDVSEEKVKVLDQNLSKYGISAKISCGKGEEYVADILFDIVLIDAPCSNSGVLNKRAEARWRINEDSLKELQKTQSDLIGHAKSLLKSSGEIWFMTCSILSEENEQLVKTLCNKHELKIKWQHTVLPNQQGWDGGYCSILYKNSVNFI